MPGRVYVGVLLAAGLLASSCLAARPLPPLAPGRAGRKGANAVGLGGQGGRGSAAGGGRLGGVMKERLRGGGLLVVGTPLAWEDSLPHLAYVREHGVLQFIHTYNDHKNRECDKLLWGEELEYTIMKADKTNKTVKLSIRGAEILEQLREREELHGRNDNRKEACAWHPEYGAWMVEGTPRMPFGGFVRDLRRVELSMRLRRQRILAALKEDELAPTVTAFPLMGTHDFTDPPTEPGGPVSQSEYCSDMLINPHPRFGTLTANIRKRRGEKVNIKVPLFIDEKTHDGEGTEEDNELVKVSGLNLHVPKRDIIHMDCMAFGMGMCCLQVTFQCRDIKESRHLYDQLSVLTPIMLSLSAATPILRGKLANTDVRWATIAASVDDRTPQERGIEVCASSHKGQAQWMAGGGKRQLPKSRYESISCYICNCKEGQDPQSSLNKYNDIDCPIDEVTYETLKAAGIDEALARHIAHLFVRDPLVIFGERIHIPDTSATDHFENIQSTNWQTVRWKPPPPGSGIGWRVEFRSMEAQLTDFENAAFTVMTVLISRVLLAFKLNLYIPLSKVDSNMATAHMRNSAVEGRFWVRSHMAVPDSLPEGDDGDGNELMSIYEILTGKGTHYTGLLPMVFAYLDMIGCDSQTRDKIRKYANLLEKRAKGELPTAATWMRNFVRRHPAYKKDSVVSQEIAYDLMRECADIGEGRKVAPELLGSIKIDPVTTNGAYEVPLESVPITAAMRNDLLRKYAARAELSKEQGGLVADGWLDEKVEKSEVGVKEVGRLPDTLLTEHDTCACHRSPRCVLVQAAEKELTELKLDDDDSSEQ